MGIITDNFLFGVLALKKQQSPPAPVFWRVTPHMHCSSCFLLNHRCLLCWCLSRSPGFFYAEIRFFMQIYRLSVRESKIQSALVYMCTVPAPRSSETPPIRAGFWMMIFSSVRLLRSPAAYRRFISDGSCSLFCALWVGYGYIWFVFSLGSICSGF